MTCAVKGCENMSLGRGTRKFCMKHYTQILRHGKIIEHTRYSLNTWKKVSSGYLFDLYDAKGEKREEQFLVDAESFERIKNFKWGYHKGYISNKKLGLLHRFLLHAPKGKYVDHINGDTKDNRISNLRICTNKENIRNRSVSKNNTTGYTGVSKHGYYESKFTSAIQVNGDKIYLGIHDTAEAAARAYNEAAIKYFGEFARLNIIKESK